MSAVYHRRQLRQPKVRGGRLSQMKTKTADVRRLSQKKTKTTDVRRLSQKKTKTTDVRRLSKEED